MLDRQIVVIVRLPENQSSLFGNIMKKTLSILLLLTACSTNKPMQPSSIALYQPMIALAQNSTSGKTHAVLKQAHKMTANAEIIKGGCWDFLDAAWTRAGVPRNERKVIFQSSIDGQYAMPEQLQAGDWIYHVNYAYHNIEHSGMFIAWVDESKHLGLTLSYAGEHRKEPARYKVYDLSGVYKITRAE